MGLNDYSDKEFLKLASESKTLMEFARKLGYSHDHFGSYTRRNIHNRLKKLGAEFVSEKKLKLINISDEEFIEKFNKSKNLTELLVNLGYRVKSKDEFGNEIITGNGSRNIVKNRLIKLGLSFNTFNKKINDNDSTIEYNITSREKGFLAELYFEEEMIKKGIKLSKPILDSYSYDYLIDINNKIYKIQVKYGKLVNNKIESLLCKNIIDYTNGLNSYSHRTYNKKEVDYFAISCPELKEICFIENNEKHRKVKFSYKKDSEGKSGLHYFIEDHNINSFLKYILYK